MTWSTRTGDLFSEALNGQHPYLSCLAAGGVSFAVGLGLQAAFTKQSGPSVLHAPPRAIGVSHEENRGNPLPSDVLPGARDVLTPYGSIRVYEWGQEDAPKVGYMRPKAAKRFRRPNISQKKKVLFCPGISTPCVSLAGLAHSLVDRGFRVMLFDLYVPEKKNVHINGLKSI